MTKETCETLEFRFASGGEPGCGGLRDEDVAPSTPATSGRPKMKLTVFGPTGFIGEQIARQALAARHEVTAVALCPEAVAPTGPRLRVLAGYVLDPAVLRDAGVRRFVGVSAVPVGPEDQKSALDRDLVHPLPHRFFGGGYDDMRRMEDLLDSSDR